MSNKVQMLVLAMVLLMRNIFFSFVCRREVSKKEDWVGVGMMVLIILILAVIVIIV